MTSVRSALRRRALIPWALLACAGIACSAHDAEREADADRVQAGDASDEAIAPDQNERDASLDANATAPLVDTAAPAPREAAEDTPEEDATPDPPVADAGAARGAQSRIADCDAGDCDGCQRCLDRSCSDNPIVGNLRRHCATLSGVATRGPSTGTSLATLCGALVTCAREKDCGRRQLEDCMCGQLDRVSCLGNFTLASGPCIEQTIAAAQTSEAKSFALGFRNPNVTLGAAMLLVECEIQHCAAACGRQK